jgi:hypothetical protein
MSHMYNLTVTSATMTSHRRSIPFLEKSIYKLLSFETPIHFICQFTLFGYNFEFITSNPNNLTLTILLFAC